MIHDIILSLLSEKEPQVIKKLLNLEISSKFIHPAEIKSLKDINKISNQYREIRKFISRYSSCANENAQIVLEIEENSLSTGFYLQAFANGLDEAVEVYHRSIVELEKKFLRKPTISLMFIFHELQKFRPLFEFITRLINGLQVQRLFGCQILQYLHDNALHGDETIMKAVQVIQRSVYTIFIQQLCQWLMYGKFVDLYEEFFIIHVDTNRRNDKKPPYSTQASMSSFHLSSEPSVNLDMWKYEINFDMLPHYFPQSWAEKVLFIGQTVLMFNSDPRELTSDGAGDVDLTNSDEKQSVWGEQEQMFFQKFHELQEVDKLTVITFEKIVDDIKRCVTEHLSEIAITEADLSKQLKLIKDFYLLGRGELYYEFIRGLKPLYNNVITANTVRDINRTFQVAAASVNIHDDVELFTFEMVKEETDSFVYETRGFFSFLDLRYKIKWPLHLLFSPLVLDKYNNLFRFLIRIKKSQNDIHDVWCHHRAEKVQRDSELLQFRNKLMFLINNLQYYLQVDVLESQFSIMMNKISETRDFEQIQRAHNCFQANILGLCFLLESTEAATSKPGAITFDENPVFTVLNKILQLVDNFTGFAYICTNPMEVSDKHTFENFEEIFASLVESLMKMLTGLQASAPLAQLLLRLDFNYWFSTKGKII